MNLTINKQEYPLNFGLRFIRELDKAYTQNVQGMEFGIGVETAITYIQMQNPTVLFELIKAGTAHLRKKPTPVMIEKELEKRAENGELETLYDDLLKAMEESVFLKPKFKRLKEVTENQSNIENKE